MAAAPATAPSTSGGLGICLSYSNRVNQAISCVKQYHPHRLARFISTKSPPLKIPFPAALIRINENRLASKFHHIGIWKPFTQGQLNVFNFENLYDS